MPITVGRVFKGLLSFRTVSYSVLFWVLIVAMCLDLVMPITVSKFFKGLLSFRTVSYSVPWVLLGYPK